MCAAKTDRPRRKRSAPETRELAPMKFRVCPSVTRQTIHDFLGASELPCPKAYEFSDRDTEAAVNYSAETPCCFDCELFETCGNGDPRYSAMPCMKDLCPLLRQPEYRRIAHARTNYVYQLNKAVGNLAGKAAEVATSINSMMLETIEEAKRRDKAETIGVPAPTREAPPDPEKQEQAKREAAAETSSIPPMAGEAP